VASSRRRAPHSGQVEVISAAWVDRDRRWRICSAEKQFETRRGKVIRDQSRAVKCAEIQRPARAVQDTTGGKQQRGR
jgi:hypothetical protein